MLWSKTVIPQPNQLWVHESKTNNIVEIKGLENGVIIYSNWAGAYLLHEMPYAGFTSQFRYLGFEPWLNEIWVSKKGDKPNITISNVYMLDSSETYKGLIKLYDTHMPAGKRHPRKGEIWHHKDNIWLSLVRVMHNTTDPLKNMRNVGYTYLNLDDDHLARYKRSHPNPAQIPEEAFMRNFNPIPVYDAWPRNKQEDQEYLGYSNQQYNNLSNKVMEGKVYLWKKFTDMTDITPESLSDVHEHLITHPIKKNSLIWQWQAKVIEHNLYIKAGGLA